MIHGAILRRDVRRTLAARWPWGLLLGLLAILMLYDTSPEGIASMLCGLFVMGAAFSAYHSLAAEREEDMLDMLATAPIPLGSVLVEIPLAAVIAWGVITLGPLCTVQVAASRVLMRDWLIAVPFALLCASQASLSTLGSGRTFAAYYLGAAAELAVVYGVARSIQPACQGSVPQVFLQVTALAVAAWCLRLASKRAAGVHWPESVDDHAAASARGDSLLDRLTLSRLVAASWWRPVPDGVPAVMWRELSRGLVWCGVAGVLVALGMLNATWFDGWGSVFVVATVPGCLILAYVAASRTASDRHGPIWDELRAVPGSPAVTWLARLGAPLLHGLIVMLPLALVCSARFDWEGRLNVAATFVAGLWLLAVLSGYVAGMRVRGWGASLAGIGLFPALCGVCAFLVAGIDRVVRAMDLRPGGLPCDYESVVMLFVGVAMLVVMSAFSYMLTARDL